MRAKTCIIPKDFREELRKLQAQKKKEKALKEDNFDYGSKRRSRHSTRGDVVTVSTLNPDPAAP